MRVQTIGQQIIEKQYTIDARTSKGNGTEIMNKWWKTIPKLFQKHLQNKQQINAQIDRENSGPKIRRPFCRACQNILKLGGGLHANESY